jgi:SAM-dependent methyltransferase
MGEPLYETSFVEFYDHMPIYQARRDAEFYLAQAVKSGGPVLELGCGTGRVLLPIARAGIEITGVDASELMLGKLREKLGREPAEVQARVKLAQAEMTNFEIGSKFALITIPFRPFQHLIRVEDEMQCLEQVRKHLAPGGRLVFDIFNPDPSRLTDAKWMEEGAPRTEFDMPDGRHVKLVDRMTGVSRANQVMEVEFIFYVTPPGGGETLRLVHPFSMRFIYRHEMEHLLARCGLRVVKLYGDLDGGDFGDNSTEMIFVAEAA